MLEWIGTFAGIASVVLTARKSIWGWPVGLVWALSYVAIFADAKLYSDTLLHGVYVGLQLYGWYQWRRGTDSSGESIVVQRVAKGGLGIALAVGALGTGVLGGAMARFTDAALPWPDAFTTAFSLVAQVLMARRVLECWWLWIAVDAVAIAVYVSKALFVTAGLYGVFLGLALYGWWQWTR
ncbi:MAG: nicotinamide riboside transporter PnuC [Myxococcota bacterium]